MNIPQKNWLEWTIFAAGLTLVVGVLAFLIYDAMTLGDTPPAMQLQVGAPAQQAGHFVVPVAVTNNGDQTAEGVLVEVTLEYGTEQEQAQFEVAFLPRGATGEGWAAFETDPSTGQLKARVIGYATP
jgi:uncharacterized protein (TIGR02588 family)